MSGNDLFLATDEGIDILDMRDPSRPVLKRQYGTHHPSRIVRIEDGLIFLYEEGKGIEILMVQGDQLKRVSFFDPGDEIKDMKISGGTLYASTQHSGLLAIDIVRPERLVIKTIYPDAPAGAQIDVSGHTVFLAGEGILKAINLLPDIHVSQKGNSTLSLTVPEKMPLGAYHLMLMAPNGQKDIQYNAIRVEPSSPSEEFSIEEYERILEERCPSCRR